MLINEPDPSRQSTLIERMIRAARFDAALYEEIEHDPRTFGQAMTVVALSAVAGGLGAASWGRLVTVPVQLVLAIGMWFLGSALIWLIGDRVMREHDRTTTYGEVLRPLGFAAAPGVLQLVGVLPVFGGPLRLLVMLWQVAATVVAVQHAFGFSETWRAVAVTLMAWVVAAIAAGVVGWMIFGSVLLGH